MERPDATRHRDVLLRLLRHAVADRPLLTQALFWLLIATASDVAGPLLIKTFIDDHLRPGLWETGPLTALAVAYITLQMLTALANYLQAVRFNKIALQAVQNIREQVFQRVLNMPIAFFDRTPTGSLISRITNDSETIKDFYVSVLATYVQNGARVLAIFIAMALLDWRLMVVCMLFVSAVATLMFFYQRLSTPRFQRARTLLSDINTRLHESIQGMKVIQLMNQSERFAQRFEATADDHYRARLSNLRLDALLLRPFVDLLHIVTLAGLLFLFGRQSLSSAVEVGVIYAFVNYLGRFIEPIIEMTQRLNLLQQALVSGRRVFELVDQPAPTTAAHGAAHISRGDIAFEHVTFSYDGIRNVLARIDCQLEAGGFYGVVGHTGSGKSTFASLLLGFYTPAAGTIRIDGHDLADIPAAELRRQVGIVQQEGYVFSGTIAANVAMGRALPATDITAACRQAGLHEFIMGLPAGYDAMLAERGANLSTGQRQLLSLARTLALKPRVLILDEATANVDSQTEAQVQEALAGLRGQVTVVAIAHRLSTVKNADRILVLHQGQLVQQGSHSALLAQEGLYRHLYQLQELQPPNAASPQSRAPSAG